MAVLLVVAVSLPVAYAIVYATGGTKFAWPYVMLIPVLIAAARFRIPGGVLAGLAGGLLLGPPMPLDVAAGTAQDTGNWLVRIGFFIALGVVAGMLFQLIHREGRKRARDARIDSESGLPNKTALVETLAAGTAPPATPPYVVLVRVVNLGEVMEAAGVGAADKLVVTLAERLHADAGLGGRIHRFSASELVVLCPGDPAAGRSWLRTILKAVERPVEVMDIPLHVELALGSAGTPPPGTAPEEIVRRARVALFAAVERDQPYCEYAPEHERRTAETVRLLAGVRRGLEAGEFELHYQPKVRAADRRADGCEALLRWRRHADGGLVPPGEFMPRVEQSALIGPLTRFVARSAFDFSHQSPGRISINISARDLLDPDLVSEIANMATLGGVPKGRIEIEITESAIMRDPEDARATIEQFRQCGFAVSLDDFGTGYSSFEYLRLLPLTGLKIDRAFVRDLETDPRAERLMACMIEVGHALDLEVVAEGIETPGQAEVLRHLGCDLLQGFHLAHPMTANEYLEWAATRGGPGLRHPTASPGFRGN